MNLRKQARNRPCQVRIPGICDGGGETTVLAQKRSTNNEIGYNQGCRARQRPATPNHNVRNARYG